MPPKTKAKAKRKKGAQPGNTNALKHGFYSETFLRGETSDLADYDLTDLTGELAALRVVIRRMLHIATDTEDLASIISLVYALSVASSTIAKLARTQQLLVGSQDSKISNAFDIALADVMIELNI